MMRGCLRNLEPKLGCEKREQEQDISEAEKKTFQVKERPEQNFRIEKIEG